MKSSLEQAEGFARLESQIRTLDGRLLYYRQTLENIKEILRTNREEMNKELDNRFQQHEQSLSEIVYRKRFLESLWFPDIYAREEGIKDAYEQTYQWLLDDSEISGASARPWDDMVQWLKYGQDTYWISGKAGSGKSTLMRYLSDHDRTKDFLEVWAGSSELLTLKFFFWAAGNSIQKSLIGLFRSLLHQILSTLPHLISLVAFNHPSRPSQHGLIQAWTEARLRKALRIALEEATKGFRLCFFLDGLDELDEDYEGLVPVIKDLLKENNVKVCLSSRPYRVFSEAFSSANMLKLHDVTRADIYTFVTGSLTSRDPQLISEMSDEIVDKAEGVFLWARLVVQEMNKGLINEDSEGQLKDRLNAIPSGIEDLYSHMLTCIDPVYREEAAFAFCGAMNDEPLLQTDRVRETPSLLFLSLYIRDRLRTDSSAFLELSAAQTLELCQSTERRLPTTCAGFLEVRWDKETLECTHDEYLYSMARFTLPSQFAVSTIDLGNIAPEIIELLRILSFTQVQFIHRTAKEFLRKNKEGIRLIGDYSSSAARSSISWLNALVGSWRLLGYSSPQWLKEHHLESLSVRANSLQYSARASANSAPERLTFAFVSSPWRDLEGLMVQAVHNERLLGSAQVLLWDYIEQAMNTAKSRILIAEVEDGEYWEIMVPTDPANKHWFSDYDTEPTVTPNMPVDFLGFAAYYGISMYLQQRLESDVSLHKATTTTYLLACCMSYYRWSPDLFIDDSGPSASHLMHVVVYLLNRGANPNAVIPSSRTSSTIWCNFLGYLYVNSFSNMMVKRNSIKGPWGATAIAFLENGADATQIWDFYSGLLLVNDDLAEAIRDSLDDVGCRLEGRCSAFAVLQHCFEGSDAWHNIVEKLNAANAKYLFKCTHFSIDYILYPSEPNLYALSERQSIDLTNQVEQCMREPEATSLRASKTLARDLWKLQLELEAAKAESQIDSADFAENLSLFQFSSCDSGPTYNE